MDLEIKFYVCESHKFAGTFAFIAELVEVRVNEISKAFVSKSTSPLSDFWVEIRKEQHKTILAGSGFLYDSSIIGSLKLIVEFEDNVFQSFTFPSPSIIEQGVLSCNIGDDYLKVKYWSKNGLSDLVPIDYLEKSKEKWYAPLSKVYIHEKKIADIQADFVPILPKSGPEQPIPKELLNDTHHPQMKELLALKGLHEGKDAVFIGNGPSLDLNLLSKFDNHILFAFNRFYLAYDQTSIRPDYLVSADQQMIVDFGKEMINKSQAKVFLAGESNLSLSGKYIWLKLINIFPALFSEDITKFVTPGGSTPYVAMQIAAYMGIKRIFLLGFDYGYQFDEQDKNRGSNVVSGEGNHFIKNYRDGKPWIPPSFRNIGQSFWTARLYFELNGGEIVNLSPSKSLKAFKN